MVLNHGKEKPSNMVAEGSFDPNTGFHLSRSAKDSDHGLECMASSHPMSKKEATDFLMDVIVAEKRGGNDEKINATYRPGGNKTSGDVHHAYAARPYFEVVRVVVEQGATSVSLLWRRIRFAAHKYQRSVP